MKQVVRHIRRYPITWLCMAGIWILSLCNPPHTSLNNLSQIDKWVHLLMYLLSCLALWGEYLRRHVRLNALKLFLFAWLAPILMSGCIELIQEFCTGGRRSGEWLDWAANAAGVSVAAIFGILVAAVRARAHKASGGARSYRNGGRP